MTTNSPNPVDGDVQAHQMPVLTEQQREDALKVALRMAANNSIPSLNDHRYSQLFAEIALAALTAEPVGYVRMDENDCEFNGNNEFSQGKRGFAVYATPPAQLLRPVELPEPYDDGHGNLWLSQDAVISAVKNAGGEVKS